MDDTQRALGRHDGEIAALQKSMDGIYAEIRMLHGAVQEIKTVLAEAKGGWKTLMLVAGVAASVGALATKFAVWIGLLPPGVK